MREATRTAEPPPGDATGAAEGTFPATRKRLDSVELEDMSEEVDASASGSGGEEEALEQQPEGVALLYAVEEEEEGYMEGEEDLLLATGETYLMDVLEQHGADIVSSSYWDFGDFGDMWKVSKPVPEGVTIEVSAAPDMMLLRPSRAHFPYASACPLPELCLGPCCPWADNISLLRYPRADL